MTNGANKHQLNILTKSKESRMTFQSSISRDLLQLHHGSTAKWVYTMAAFYNAHPCQAYQK